MKLEKELEKLIQIYRKRIDLQDTYPEVEDGDYQALLNWAAGVSSKRWEDGDYDTLYEFKNWYAAHEAVVNRPKNEQSISEIIETSNVKMKYTLKNIVNDSDISEHLTTLFFLTVEFNLKRVLELGVRDGLSNTALVEAASKIGGHVWSIDIDSCDVAKRNISQANLNEYWTFIQGDDIKIGIDWKQELDHIFIDTSHTYQHTLNEINTYEKFLVKNGFITFHDTRSFPGVLKAIKEFMSRNPERYNFYNYFNNNGFAIIRKIY